MMSEISQVVKFYTDMTTTQESNNIQVVITTSSNVKISGIARNYVKWHKHYYWGINPWDNATTIVFQLGRQWFVYSYGGNYTSQYETFEEVTPQKATEEVRILREAFAETGDDDGRNSYLLVEESKKEVSLSLDLDIVAVTHGPIGKAVSSERQWRKAHSLGDSVTRQVLASIGRYEIMDVPNKGLHDYVVKAVSDGKVYSVDVSKRAGMGYWIYDAVVKEFSPETEAAKRREFGRKVRALSLTSGVPFDVVKMLGETGMADPKADEMLHLLKLVHDLPKSEDELHELSCGIDRRKAELQRLLPEAVYDFFGVSYLGQGRSSQLAGYVAGGC